MNESTDSNPIMTIVMTTTTTTLVIKMQCPREVPEQQKQYST